MPENMWRLVLIFPLLLGLEATQSKFYDSYTGEELSDQEVVQRVKENKTFWCTTEAAPCDPNEGRRVGGACNNPKYPSRGAGHTPFLSLLPNEFGKDFEPRLMSNGQPPPNGRYTRTLLLATGTRPDQKFTTLATHFILFTIVDVASIQDSVNYVLWKPYCCQPKGKADHDCTPQPVPARDNVHRFSDVTCFNLTRPISYQTNRCRPNNTMPERITSATSTYDLSHLYGNVYKNSLEKTRLFSRGMLKYEVDDGRIYPPSSRAKENLCLLNQPPYEKRCHDTGEDGVNSLLGVNLFTIWLWRYHNVIASTLADLNPSWDDEKLYKTALDINIATVNQIMLYEFFPLILGRRNMINDGLISSDPGFRDMYNDEWYPQVYLEYLYINRWFHLMQDGRTKMYDESGNYLKQIPIVNLTLRTGYLAIDNHLDYITQGSFRQASGKVDYIVDPEMSESVFGPLQRASDVFTSDLVKGRYFGIQPYIKYVKLCTGITINCFEDLKQFMSADKIELLQELYPTVEDLEIFPSVWLEDPVPGGYAPPTFYCLAAQQFLRTMSSDRHWYERPNRPNAFTYKQLQEIRKASISRLLCDVADKVTHIQPQGFLREGPNNKMVSCSELPKMDLSAWKDTSI